MKLIQYIFKIIFFINSQTTRLCFRTAGNKPLCLFTFLWLLIGQREIVSSPRKIPTIRESEKRLQTKGFFSVTRKYPACSLILKK